MKMASNDFGNVVDTFYQALQKTQTIPGALKAVVDAIPETGALTGKAMELTREQIGNACHAWLQKAMEASKSVRVLDPEEVIEAVTPHVQYAAIPETGALTEEQWNQLRTEFGTGESTVHRWLCRSDIERVLSSRPSPTPAPKSAAPTDVQSTPPAWGATSSACCGAELLERSGHCTALSPVLHTPSLRASLPRHGSYHSGYGLTKSIYRKRATR
jgi:hypothetical protein